MEKMNPQLFNIVLLVSTLIVSNLLKVQGEATLSTGLVLPVERTTGLGCIPEGSTVSYECTVTDPLDPPVASTVWQGTAFNCSSINGVLNNRITLTHSQFPSESASGVCGGLSAMSTKFKRNEYTSRLTLTAITGLKGLNVTCTLGGSFVVGSDILRTGAPPPPPQSFTVEFVSTSSLNVSWTAPSNTNNIRGYLFLVTGEDCGCVSMNISADTTRVSCPGWMVMNQTCSFEVSAVSQDCGFTSDSIKESVVLMVPPAPTQLRVVFSAHQIEVEFMQAEFSLLGNSAVTYTVVLVGNNVSMNFTGLTCNETSRCNLNFTFHNLTSDSYIVSVFASNIFGSGPRAVYVECNPEELGSNPTSLNGSGMVNISNGLFCYSGVSPRSVATLQCNDGYRADSVLNRTCMFGGQWSEGALECVRVDGGTRITPACPLYCAVLVGVFVSVTVIVLIIVCIAIALYILKKYGRECFTSINMSEKVQYRANRESPNTNESSLSLVDTQPSKAKIDVNRSEPSQSAQVDTYANPEDFIKTPPHMHPRKNEVVEDQGEVPKPLTVNDEVPCAQYESIVARPVEVTSQQVYSEVFDALPKGKSKIIVK